MWVDITTNIKDFSSAVLSGVTTNGYPFSIRCHPRLDDANQLLKVQVPESSPLQAGKASILWHKHDELLWNLKSFVVRGDLQKNEQGEWIFRPQQFIPGAAVGGLWGFVGFIRNGRKTTKRYLEKRGLERPKIDWKGIQDAWEHLGIR